MGILAGEGSSTGLYGYISGFDDDLKLLDPITALSVDDIPLGSLCDTTIPLYFDYLSCVDSINVISALVLQGNATIIDSNASDTVLHAIINPNFNGIIEIQVVVEDSRGFRDSVVYEFEYYGASYDPVQEDTLSVCNGQPVVLQVQNPATGLSYLWSTGDTTVSTTAFDP